ncbi:Na+/H+ antiporter NhaC [Roseibium sp.]|uniref:Na+/H+ antiporter NhaC n=1 Tax=Roseibium sp. TaxID=1936156 RepID=UPI003A97CF80
MDKPSEESAADERPVGLSFALLPILALVLLLGLAYYLFGDEAAAGPNQIALLFCALIASWVGIRHGIPFSVLGRAAVDSVATGISALFILLAVGALIGSWALSGTIMAMVYWGIQLLSPNYFYMTTALICASVALCVGSSWTVAGTIGIGLIGVADQMDLNPAIAAGAVISGAYFGDKSSPLSDATNLATVAANSNLYEHIKETLWTSVPSLVLALLAFWMLGQPADFDASSLTRGLEQQFNVSLVTFLPLVLVLILAIMRFPPFTTIFLGALAGGLLAVVIAPDRVVHFAEDPELARPFALIKGVWAALATGYTSNTGNPEIDQLLSRGGMSGMMTTIWLILTALAFGGVVERVGILGRILEPVIRFAKGTGALVSSLVGASLATNILASDQYIAIVLPGRMFRTIFRQRNLSPVVLSRAIGDSATVTSALIPWNSCGAYMAATLGVATVNYAPFAVFNLVNPLITVLIAFLGLRMLPVRSEAKA